MSEVTSEELDGQLELSRQRFEQVTEQIRTVLVSDASSFIGKSAKTAFLNQPAVSDALSDGQLAQLKAQGGSLGASLGEELERVLLEPSCWLSGPVSTQDERSLEGIQEVWGALDRVGAQARDLLERFGFETQGLTYVPPKYFVGGLYLPTLVEHYWRLRLEMEALQTQRADLAAQTTRRRLQARWEEV